MINKVWLLALSGLLLLNGCASMNKDACLNADWRTIGFEDGSKGKHEGSISQYRQECARHGVTPDLDAYLAGHREGSDRFCTPSNGFRTGQAGTVYNNSCPPALEAAFLAAHADGQQLHRLQRHLQQQQAELNKTERQLSTMESELVIQEELLIADGYTREERLEIREQIILLQMSINEGYGRLAELQQLVQQADADYQRSFRRLSARY